MGEWINIPSHRVLRLSKWEFERDFFCLDEEGKEYKPSLGSMFSPFRIYRRADMMMFLKPKHIPMFEDYNNMITLEPYHG